MSPLLILGVALGGALGSAARHGAAHLLSRHAFPWGTLIVNVLGTGIFGATLAAAERGALTGPWQAVIGAGLAGGLTTFSTLAVDAVGLWRSDRIAHAGAYLAATVVAGILAGWAGYALAAG